MEHAPFRVRGNSVRHGFVQGALRPVPVEGILDRRRWDSRGDGALRTDHQDFRSPVEQDDDGLYQAGDQAQKGRREVSDALEAQEKEGARRAATTERTLLF